MIIPTLLPVIGSILPGIFPGLFPMPPANLPSFPAFSISHSTSVATVINKKPVAITHSGSVSTGANRPSNTASGSATVKNPTFVAEVASRAIFFSKLFKALKKTS